MNADIEITAEAIARALEDALQPTILDVIDESADHIGHVGSNGTGRGTHFRVSIGGPVFVGCSRVVQHRLVYDALREFTSSGLHALAIEIRT